jgi:hypothetical protein
LFALNLLSWKEMSAQEIIQQIKALPADERAKITEFVREEDDAVVPESFKAGMKAAAEGRFVEMATALRETPPPGLR